MWLHVRVCRVAERDAFKSHVFNRMLLGADQLHDRLVDHCFKLPCRRAGGSRVRRIVQLGRLLVVVVLVWIVQFFENLY